MAKILVVDDSEDLLEMLTLLLKMNGHEVATSYNKTEAFKSMASSPPDLVLIDVWLGNKSGKDLCAAIKQKNKKIPVLLMSANPEILIDSKEACNADAAIEKPFDINLINQTINSLLTKK